MMALGLTFWMATFAPSAAPEGVLSGPRLKPGDELHYVGQIQQNGERIENRFRKKFKLEVRVFVLEASEAATDCAVLTTITPLGDESIQEAVKIASGRSGLKADDKSAVRIDLIRLDDRGHATAVRPKRSLPLELNTKTPMEAIPGIALDAPTPWEFGMFAPLPVRDVKVGSNWNSPDGDRPPVAWTAKDGAVWNGRSVVEVAAVQQSTGFDAPDKFRRGWKRSETLLLSPSDGYAVTLERTVEQRDGNEVFGSVAVQYQLQPMIRHTGAKLEAMRAEVEKAWYFSAECDAMLSGRSSAESRAAAQREITRYLDTKPSASSFRPALEAVQRRYETQRIPPVTPRIAIQPEFPSPPKLGAPAPDFLAAQADKATGEVRLSALKGQPVVLVFYKPGSPTSEETLAVCEALHRKYSEKAAILPLAIGASLIAATNQKTELNYRVPIYDGAAARKAYAVESWPQFSLVDSKGILRWSFDAGIGPEVGSLVKKELEATLAGPEAKR